MKGPLFGEELSIPNLVGHSEQIMPNGLGFKDINNQNWMKAS